MISKVHCQPARNQQHSEKKRKQTPLIEDQIHFDPNPNLIREAKMLLFY